MAESFLEEAGLGGEEDGACDEEIEVPKYIFKLSYFARFCPFLHGF